MMLVYLLTGGALAEVTILSRRIHLTDQIDLFETTNAPFELFYAVDALVNTVFEEFKNHPIKK